MQMSGKLYKFCYNIVTGISCTKRINVNLNKQSLVWRLNLYEFLSLQQPVTNSINFERTLCTFSDDTKGSKVRVQTNVDNADTFGTLDEQFREKYYPKWPNVLKRDSKFKRNKQMSAKDYSRRKPLKFEKSESQWDISANGDETSYKTGLKRNIIKRSSSKKNWKKSTKRQPSKSWDDFGTLAEREPLEDETSYKTGLERNIKRSSSKKNWKKSAERQPSKSWDDFGTLAEGEPLEDETSYKTDLERNIKRSSSKKNWKKSAKRQPSKPWDVFGTLAEGKLLEEEADGFIFTPADTGFIDKPVEDEEDMDNLETSIAPANHIKLKLHQYEKKISQLVKEKKLKEALEMYHLQMLKIDHVMPSKCIYAILINGCGRVGYTKEAFKLYRQMTDRGLRPSVSVFTGLFNACSNSPWPEDGLNRASKLREKMIEKGFIPNTIHYHVMIKAFGKCNDLLTAFEIVDEMIAKKYAISDHTLSFILMACAQNKEAGFRFAIQAWRRIRRKRIPPSIFTYNLLLRITRDCGAGNPELLNDLLSSDSKPYEPPPPLPLSESEKLAALTSSQTNDMNCSQRSQEQGHSENQLVFANRSEVAKETKKTFDLENPTIPDLLSYKVQPGSVVALGSLDSAESRLAVLGGMQGFLSRMVRDRVKPDKKTFTLLLDMIPSTKEAEETLLSALDEHSVAADIDFFNLLIKRRNWRCETESGKEVLEMIRRRSLKPDIVTFGVLAIGCKRSKDGYAFLKDMKDAGFRPNVEIIGALLDQALHRQNWNYITNLLKEMKKEDISANSLILDKLEALITAAKKTIIKAERDEEVEAVNDIDQYKDRYKKFVQFYEDWLKLMPLDLSEDPWEFYRPQKNLNEEATLI